MRGTILILSLFALTTVKAGHALECTSLDGMAAQQPLAVPPEGPSCDTYLTTTSQEGLSCHWTFPYRSDAAKAFAEAMWQTIQQCRSGSPREPDQNVNHPDSYELRQWDTGQAIYSLSVKDKGALGLTLVFVRRAPLHRAD